MSRGNPFRFVPIVVALGLVGQAVSVRAQQERQGKPDSAADVIGPHILALEQTLEATSKGLRSLREQVAAKEGALSNRDLEGIRTQSHRINRNINAALAHQNMLKEVIDKYPRVGRNRDFQAMMSSLDRLRETNDEWWAKIDEVSYGRDEQQLAADLERLHRRVGDSMSKARQFHEAAGWTGMPEMGEGRR